jgi:hypothetical protein
MSKIVKKKWEIRRRLEEIDRQLYWAGNVGRTNLIGRFGISPQQASADLKSYLESAGDKIRFNGAIKRYVPQEGFEPIFVAPSLEDYIHWSGGVGHELITVPLPYRSIDLGVLRMLSIAIHQQLSVEIRYRSLSTPEGTVRRITPHSIVFTGTRYHVRAYCHHRNGFRDFVLGRIIEASDHREPGPGKEADDAWNTLLIVRIGPHPSLSDKQRTVIEADYAMTNGETQLRIKQALLLYILDQFKLDGNEAERPAEEQQIILLNPEILAYSKFSQEPLSSRCELRMPFKRPRN